MTIGKDFLALLNAEEEEEKQPEGIGDDFLALLQQQEPTPDVAKEEAPVQQTAPIEPTGDEEKDNFISQVRESFQHPKRELSQIVEPLTERKEIVAPLKELEKAVAFGTEQTVGSLGKITSMLAEIAFRDPVADEITKKYSNSPGIIDLLHRNDAQTMEFRKNLSDKGNAWAKEWEQKAQEGFSAPTEGVTWKATPVSKTMQVVGQALPLYATAIASTVITKSPTIGAAMFGTVQASDTYESAKKAGLGVEQARTYALMDGAWTTLSEYIPFSRMLGREGIGLLTRIAKGSLEEGIQEVVQQVGSNIIAKYGFEKGRKLFEGWLESLVGGVFLGGAGGAVIGSGGQQSEAEVIPKEELIKQRMNQLNEELEGAKEVEDIKTQLKITKEKESLEKELRGINAEELKAAIQGQQVEEEEQVAPVVEEPKVEPVPVVEPVVEPVAPVKEVVKEVKHEPVAEEGIGQDFTELLEKETVEEGSRGFLFTKDNEQVENIDLADKMVDKLIDSSDTFEQLSERMNSHNIYLRGGFINQFDEYFSARKKGETSQSFSEWRRSNPRSYKTEANAGVKEAIDFYKGKNKRLKVEFMDSITLQDQVDSKQITDKQAKDAIKEAGLKIKPSEAVIFGSNYVEKINNVINDVIKLSKTDADITTVIEENAELYIKNKVINDPNFNEELSNLRRVYENQTKTKSKKSDGEWFSDLAIDYAVHGKINQRIGLKLKSILNRFKAYAKEILKRAGKLRKDIKAGKIDQALINELAKATGLEAEVVVKKPEVKKKETVADVKAEKKEVVDKEKPVIKDETIKADKKQEVDKDRDNFLNDGDKIKRGDLIKYYMKSDKWEIVGENKVGVIINKNQEYLVKRKPQEKPTAEQKNQPEDKSKGNYIITMKDTGEVLHEGLTFGEAGKISNDLQDTNLLISKRETFDNEFVGQVFKKPKPVEGEKIPEKQLIDKARKAGQSIAQGQSSYQIRKAETAIETKKSIQKEKIKKQPITENDIRERVKLLKEELSESPTVQFKAEYSKGVNVPKELISDYRESLKKHGIRINSTGTNLDTAVREFTNEDMTTDEFINMLDSTTPVDLSTKALRDQVIDTKFESLKSKAQAKRIEIDKKFRDKSASHQETKQAIIDYAKANLVLKDRGKLLSTVKKAKTARDLTKAIDMMNRFATKTQRASLKLKIKKELKTIKPKKGKGKFTPEIQVILDKMREANRMTKLQAEDKLAQNLKAKEVTSAMARENVILDIKINSNDMSVEQLQRSLAEIKGLKDTGRLIRELEKADYREDIDAKVAKIVNVVDGTVGQEKKGDVANEPVTRKDGEEKFWNKMKTFGKSFVGWNDILDMLSTNDKTSEAFKSDLNKIAKVSDVETAEKKGNRIILEEITRIGKDIYNVKNDKKLVKQFIKDSKVYLKIGKLEFTKAQARKRYMEFQDPSLDETFFNMGYTDAIKRKIVDSLTPQDIAFANAQLDFYEAYYKGVNEVYSARNGINLPRIINYSPVARLDYGVNEDQGDLLNEAEHRRSIAPTATSFRTDNKLELDQRSDVDVLARHISDAEHYKAWEVKINELNAIFGDSDVRKSIEAQYGHNTMLVVDKFIKDFTRGRIDTAGNFRTLDKIRIRFTTSVLGLKPALAVKQMASMPAFAENIPAHSFVLGLADFMLNPVKKANILFESEALRERWTKAGVSRDIRDAMSSKEFSAFRKAPTFKNMLMFATRLGDSGAIVWGGWTNYRYARKQGKSHEEALKFFEEQFSQAQQSADLSQLSEWQRGSSFQKMFTMFTSSQNQYYRREVGAIRNLIAKRTTKTQAAKTIAIYHFVLPMLFQFIAAGFKWDTEDQLRAAIIGSYNGLFILGDALEALVREAQGLYSHPNELPFWGTIKEFKKAISGVDWNDIASEDVIQASKDLASGAGMATGFPVKAVINAYEGYQDFMDDDIEKGVKRMLGWSKYTIEQSERNE